MAAELFHVQSGRIGRLQPSTLRAVAASHGLTIAFGSGEMKGESFGAALAADWFTVAPDATLILDSPAAWSGAALRVGRRVLQLHLLEPSSFDAVTASRNGLCDAVGQPHESAEQWLDRWIAGRDLIALESAAALIRFRSGDRLERAEFGRLFAAGTPQAGLRAFLGRKSR